MRRPSFAVSNNNNSDSSTALQEISATSLRRARNQSLASNTNTNTNENINQGSVTSTTLTPSLTQQQQQRPTSKSFIALNRKNAARAPAKSSLATAVKWEKLEDNLVAEIHDSNNNNNNSNDEINNSQNITNEGGASNNNSTGENNSNSSSSQLVTEKALKQLNSKGGGTKNVSSKNQPQPNDTASTTSATTPSSSSGKKHSVTLRRRFRGTAALLQRHETDDSSNNTDSNNNNNNLASAKNGTFQRNVENAGSLVSRSPLFTTLRDRRVIDRIAETVRWCTAQPGEYIVVAGDVATEMYFIYAGIVEILLPVSDEEEMPVATLQGGDFFGEIALVSKDKTLRTANVQSVKQCELLVLSRKDLESVIAVSDELRECLELEANKRLASLRQREAKLLSDEVDIDLDLMKKAALNPLSAIECEWRLLSKARIRGSHRNQPPPATFIDVMEWARHHAQNTPWPLHGKTTAALTKLPSSWLDTTLHSQDGNANDQGPSSSQQQQQQLLLLHPEMGSVYKYSQVIDVLAGPDEFDNLCRSFARLLMNALTTGSNRGNSSQNENGNGVDSNKNNNSNKSASSSSPTAVLEKQALGALALAAQVTLYFAHNFAKRERFEFLMDFVDEKISRELTASTTSVSEREAILSTFSLSAHDGLPTFVLDQNLLSEMSAGLFKAPCWCVSQHLLFEQYPKSFVLSDAWAIVTLERIVRLREECIRQVCEIVIEQMIERHIFIVRKHRDERSRMEKEFRIRRAVIKKAFLMLLNVESNHRDKLFVEVEAAAAGLWRWHEVCLSFVASQKSAQESALAGQLANTTFGSHATKQLSTTSNQMSMLQYNNNNNNVGGFGGSASAKRARSAGLSTSASRGGTNLLAGSSKNLFSGRSGIALLVAQKERMADEAIHFQKRVKLSRY